MSKRSKRESKRAKLKPRPKNWIYLPQKYWVGLGLLSLLVITSIIGVVVLFVSPQQPKVESGVVFDFVYKPNEQEFVKRNQIKLSWLSAAEAVVRVTNDKDAREVYGFLLRNAVLGKPYSDGIELLERARTKPRIVVLPLLPEDRNINPNLDKVLDSENPALFFAEDNFIILRETAAISPTWKGLALLHEGYHALVISRDRLDYFNKSVSFGHERDTYNFQFRLTKLLGGTLYQSALAREVVNLREVLKEEGHSINTRYPGGQSLRYLSVLDQVFGPPQSELEMSLRETSFWLHSVFTLVDEDYQGNTAVFKSYVIGDANLLKISPPK